MRDSKPEDLKYIEELQAEIDRLKGELIIERTRRENAVNAYHEKVLSLRANSEKRSTLIYKVTLDAEQVEKIKKDCLSKVEYNIDVIKAEAVKEFGKLLIDKSQNGVIYVCDLPDFVKEMEGDAE